MQSLVEWLMNNLMFNSLCCSVKQQKAKFLKNVNHFRNDGMSKIKLHTANYIIHIKREMFKNRNDRKCEC